MKSSVFCHISGIVSFFRVEERAKQEACVIILASCLAYSSTLRMIRYVPSNRRLTFTGLHSVISKKIELFLYLLIFKHRRYGNI
jgi:hypothetical protein